MTRSALAKPWNERWLRAEGGDIRGGQGLSFVATARDGSGRRAFVKTLLPGRVTDRRARRRFKREASAYETLAGLGLPQLFDHNAETCEDGRTPMYMATAFIDGVNLRDRIRNEGPVDVDSAMACARELAVVLTRCHENGVTHRDIKPANIVLQFSDITRPVLVDFGLSFNDADDDDLTRVNDEVGNRFLRLPEHSSGGRGAASDVTQLTGIFLYAITGHEPRVLRDETGLMPHQRSNTRNALEKVLTPRQFLRLMFVFDQAFAIELQSRHQSTSDLIAALERAMNRDLEDSGGLEELIAQVDEQIASRGLAILREQRESLEQLMTEIYQIFQKFAIPRGLEATVRRVDLHVTHGEQFNECCLSVYYPGEQPKAWTTHRIDHSGAGEYVVRIDTLEVWRGSAVNETLTAAVQRSAAELFLATYGQDS